MRRLLYSLMLITALSMSLASSQSRAGTLLGISLEGTLYNVNPTTGVATDPLPTGITSVLGIAAGQNGTLYSITTYSGTPDANSLYTIDPNTGASTLVGATGLVGIIEGDLAFNPVNGVLYGVQLAQGTDIRQLFTVDVATGATQIVASINDPDGDLSAMSFTTSGKLYMVDTQNSLLLQINATNGQVISNVSLSRSLGDVAGMAIDPTTGVAYLADGGVSGTNSLYRLTLSTGTLNLIGSTDTPSGLSGLTFASTGNVVPEPQALVLAGTAFGALVMAAFLRRGPSLNRYL
jgi:hypothetical protein